MFFSFLILDKDLFLKYVDRLSIKMREYVIKVTELEKGIINFLKYFFKYRFQNNQKNHFIIIAKLIFL